MITYERKIHLLHSILFKKLKLKKVKIENILIVLLKYKMGYYQVIAEFIEDIPF